MACVAVNTVVNITTDFRVAEISRNVVPVANGALKHRVGRPAGVAIEAIAVVVVKLVEPGVGKLPIQPITRRGVARGARGRGDPGNGSVGGRVIWHNAAQSRCAVPLGHMAARANNRWHGRADVAKGASSSDVRADQRESSGAVVKDRAQPRSRRVAILASLLIPEGDMVWSWRIIRGRICGALIKCIVAAIASNGQVGGVTGRTDVAQGACSAHVRSSQRECGVVVVEHRVRPGDGVMAKRAIRGERRGHVIGYVGVASAQSYRRVVGIQMAARAGGWYGRIVPSNVTLGIDAGQRRHRVRVG